MSDVGILNKKTFHAIRLLIAMALLGLVTGCSDSATLEKDREALMDLHDTEMARMGEIFTLKEKLTFLADSLTSDEDKAILGERIDRLQEANEAMMQWMRDYREPSADMPAEEQKAYFSEEMEKMKIVERLIAGSIDSARVVLNNYQSR